MYRLRTERTQAVARMVGGRTAELTPTIFLLKIFRKRTSREWKDGLYPKDPVTASPYLRKLTTSESPVRRGIPTSGPHGTLDSLGGGTLSAIQDVSKVWRKAKTAATNYSEKADTLHDGVRKIRINLLYRVSTEGQKAGIKSPEPSQLLISS